MWCDKTGCNYGSATVIFREPFKCPQCGNTGLTSKNPFMKRKKELERKSVQEEVEDVSKETKPDQSKTV